MRLAYSLVLTVAALMLVPWFFFRRLVKKRSMGGLLQRLGWQRPPVVGAGKRPTIWLHAVSVGEVLSARPLCRALRMRYPESRLIVSTTTVTGQEVARSQLLETAEIDGLIFYPLDWSFAVRRMLDHIEPELVILMESELWLNFLSECRQRSIPVLVVNGRISDRSLRRALRVKWFVGRLYRLVTRMAMQTREDGERAVALGASPDIVTVSGNLKYDAGMTAAMAEGEGSPPEVLRGLAKDWLLVAGSTHRGEEAIVIEAFRRLKAVFASNGLKVGTTESQPQLRLLIAPRHPERFVEAGQLIEASGLRYVARSGMRGAEDHIGTEVILLDTIGELARVCGLARVVLVGGSLVPIGGHNILEPALSGRPVIVGPHMTNFREMTAQFLREGALIQLRPGTAEELTRQLVDAWCRLLRDPVEAGVLGERARLTVEANRGATTRTMSLVAQLLAAR